MKSWRVKMNKEIADELINLYKKSIDDNKEDFMVIISILSKLCSYLLNKKILTDEEVKNILKIEKLEEK